jgi:hypothetical protein
MSKKIYRAASLIFDRVKRFARNFSDRVTGGWGSPAAIKFSGREDPQRK